MIRFYSLFVLLDLALVVFALISCLSADEGEIRALPRIAWVFIILLFSPVGPIVWFVAGRPPKAIRMSNGKMWRPGSGLGENQRPVKSTAPDDDPECLKNLAAELRDDESMMKKWENDLKRREEELRRKQAEPEA